MRTNKYEIALQVWQGKWGAEPERSRRLTSAGYDPDEIQDLVNTFSPDDLAMLARGIHNDDPVSVPPVSENSRVLKVDLDLTEYDAIQVNFKVK